MNFTLTKEQYDKIQKWVKDEVYPAALEHQKKTVKNPDWCYTSTWELGYPYEGAIGGGLTYCFTPTSLGISENVVYENGDFKMKLNVTDYDNW
jgi:hypothetical protein